MNKIIMQSVCPDPVHSACMAKLKQDIITHVELDGEHHGLQNKPNTQFEFQTLTLNYIQVAIQSGIDINQGRFLPVSGMIVANKAQLDCQTKVESLQANLRDRTHKLKTLKNEAEALRRTILLNPWSWVAYVCLIAISASEGWLSYPGFRYAGFPTFAAISAACGIVFGVGLGAHYLGGYIQRSETKPQF